MRDGALFLRPDSAGSDDGGAAAEGASAGNENPGWCTEDSGGDRAVVGIEEGIGELSSVGSNDVWEEGYPDRFLLGTSEGCSEGSKVASSFGCVDRPDEEMRDGLVPLVSDSGSSAAIAGGVSDIDREVDGSNEGTENGNRDGTVACTGEGSGELLSVGSNDCRADEYADGSTLCSIAGWSEGLAKFSSVD